MTQLFGERSARHLFASIALLAVILAACSGTAPPSSAVPGAPSATTLPAPSTNPSVANPTVAASLSPNPSPSAAALPACLDKATYDLLTQIKDAFESPEALVKKNAAALIAGLEGFAPPAKFDADYRDKVVAALKAVDYSTASGLISDGLVTAQWQVTSC